MRKLLNTLHVMTQGAYVHRDGETVAIKIGQELKLRVPVHTLEGLVCWGQISCSPPLLGFCCNVAGELDLLVFLDLDFGAAASRAANDDRRRRRGRREGREEGAHLLQLAACRP